MADSNVIPITNGKRHGRANPLGKLYCYPKALLYQDYFCREEERQRAGNVIYLPSRA